MTFRADKMVVARIHVEMVGKNSVEVLFAYVDSKTGATHGYVTETNHPPAVRAALRGLIDALSQAAMETHFGTESVTPADTTPDDNPVGGISENLRAHAKPLLGASWPTRTCN